MSGDKQSRGSAPLPAHPGCPTGSPPPSHAGSAPWRLVETGAHTGPGAGWVVSAPSSSSSWDPVLQRLPRPTSHYLCCKQTAKHPANTRLHLAQPKASQKPHRLPRRDRRGRCPHINACAGMVSAMGNRTSWYFLNSLSLALSRKTQSCIKISKTPGCAAATEKWTLLKRSLSFIDLRYLLVATEAEGLAAGNRGASFQQKGQWDRPRAAAQSCVSWKAHLPQYWYFANIFSFSVRQADLYILFHTCWIQIEIHQLAETANSASPQVSSGPAPDSHWSPVTPSMAQQDVPPRQTHSTRGFAQQSHRGSSPWKRVKVFRHPNHAAPGHLMEMLFG